MRRFRRRRYRTQHAALLAAGGALALLPLRARIEVCALLARIAGLVAFDGIARQNLKTAFGVDAPREVRKGIRKANARALGRFAAELVDYARRGGSVAKDLVFSDETFRHLEEALRLDKGAIVITPHFGNWELFPAYMATLGYQGAVVARTPANPYLARFMEDMRARAGVKTLDSLRGQRQILEVLSKGGILGLLPDLDSKRTSGEFVTFFGKPSWTPTGPARLAISSGAPIVTSYIVPEGRRYRLSFEPMLRANPGAEKREEVLRLTQEWSARFEARIRERPELWVWMHDRWATTPEKADERRRRRAGMRPAAP